MASDLTALNSALSTLGTDVGSLGTGVTNLVAEVTALIKLVQANPTVDYTQQVTALNSMAATLVTNAQTIQAAATAAKPTTGF